MRDDPSCSDGFFHGLHSLLTRIWLDVLTHAVRQGRSRAIVMRGNLEFSGWAGAYIDHEMMPELAACAGMARGFPAVSAYGWGAVDFIHPRGCRRKETACGGFVRMARNIFK
ncbi:hypothetical protein [Komagataeibacter europaeus]|uniref:hypothetical protein n=1 Tax=Komagataeibacter europaeus TaxID=33995 RepID=UPI000B58685E|nr:hypothetical protein [Komagataeibacter europaeus]ARW17919.1 hypothetical protein S101446_02837 [Komagataeibacter europaeus]